MGALLPHKSRLWIIRSEDSLALIGPALLWLQNIAATLLSRLRFVRVITLEVLRSKCVEGKFSDGLKIPPTSSHVAELLGLRALRTHGCKTPCN